jgi:hypothetical protein
VSDLQELEAVLEHMEMLQTMSGNVFSENNNIKSFSNWAWNYKISCKKSKRCTVPIPCLRETWLHLLTDCILDPPRKNDGLALQTPEFLKTHVRSEEKKTDFATVSAANSRARKDGSDSEAAECLFPARGRLGYTC